MSELTGEDCEAGFVVALQNDSGVTDLLPNGDEGIGSGTVTTQTQYPYILVTHVDTDVKRAMGYEEIDAMSRMFVKVFAIDVPGTPAKQVINAIHKAVIACLNQSGSVSITGREIDRPVYDKTNNNRSQTINDNQILYWSDTVWNMFSTPSQ